MTAAWQLRFYYTNFLNYIKHSYWEDFGTGFGIGLIISKMYPGSMSNFDITEKNSM